MFCKRILFRIQIFVCNQNKLIMKIRFKTIMIICINIFAGPDHFVPPAGFAVFGRMLAGNVGIAGKGVGDQYRIGAVAVQYAAGFVTENHILQFPAAIKGQGGSEVVIFCLHQQSFFVAVYFSNLLRRKNSF